MILNSTLTSISKAVVLIFIISIYSMPLFAGVDKPVKVVNDEIEEESPYVYVDLLMNVLELVKENYVDKSRVTYKRLFTGALKGMIHELDPFSRYEEPVTYKKTKADTKGVFGGVGIHVTFKNGILTVITPMEEGPAFKGGIRSGDVILNIDGVSTQYLSLDDLLKKIKGPPNTLLTFKIYRKTNGGIIKDITIERAIIKSNSVVGSKIIKEGIGYIRIKQFSKPTAAKFLKNLNKLKKQNLRGLIIDLRNNPGGLLRSAINICSFFLKSGELIAYTEGRKLKDRVEFKSILCEKTLDIPIVILVNGHSASASEIVSACLQDHKRAVLVGERTFGKGSVQTIIPLPNKGAIRFTTAKYYTPSKKVIHGHGVDPDIYVNLSIKSKIMLVNQISRFPGVIKPKAANSLTDVQLKRAVEIIKGICIYNEAKNGK